MEEEGGMAFLSLSLSVSRAAPRRRSSGRTEGAGDNGTFGKRQRARSFFFVRS